MTGITWIVGKFLNLFVFAGLYAWLASVFHWDYQGGRTRLPKFKFSAKFPIGLHVILQIQIRKFENDCYYVKNYFNRKSVEV